MLEIMSTLRRQIGAMVRHHRELAGLTQAELGDKVGKALESIGRIERGEITPSLKTLEELAAALQVDVRDFFEAGSFAVKDRKGDPLAKILERLSALNADDLEWADKLIVLALSRKSRR
jgi:transcriptional regulator with XRE-family HTH domain